MRALLVFSDGRTVDRDVKFPPPTRLQTETRAAVRRFKLVGDTWAPTCEAQLAVYEEVARKIKPASKARVIARAEIEHKLAEGGRDPWWFKEWFKDTPYRGLD